MKTLLLNSASAAAMLGVSKATLYAYVSRGLVEAEADRSDPRRRLYRVGDIARLKSSKAVGRKPEKIAAKTLDWGSGAMPSRITLIDRNRLFYRGQDAMDLARAGSLEDVARLLWDCEGDDPFRGQPPRAADPRAKTLTEIMRRRPPIERCQALLPILVPDRHALPHRDPKRLRTDAAILVRFAAGALLGKARMVGPIHREIATAWKLNRDGGELVRAALVLLADHELNASTFAVRVVASTGASLAACAMAGLAALSGPLHGGATALAEVLLDEVDRQGDASAVITERLNRGDQLPGFGHPLYHDGDPRAEFLLSRLPSDPARSELVAAVDRIGGQLPNVDFALVALRRALALPRGAALLIFAVARLVGWMAHALEQHFDGKLIRPRAQYVGPRPEQLSPARQVPEA